MRKILLLSLLGCVLFGFARRAWADDDPQAIIARAVKAFGGEEKLASLKAVRTKSKGTINSANLDFTQEVSAQIPGQFKEVLQLQVKGEDHTIATVFNGDKGWFSVDGKTQEMDDKLLDEMKEVAHMMNVNRLVTLKDKAKYDLSPLGEIKVADQPAAGVRVTSKGHRDLNLYFYKDSGLLAKVERRALDIMSRQEVTEERVILEYQDLNGRKTARKAAVYRDGKKILEAEVLEVKVVDKFDDSEFAKP